MFMKNGASTYIWPYNVRLSLNIFCVKWLALLFLIFLAIINIKCWNRNVICDLIKTQSFFSVDEDGIVCSWGFVLFAVKWILWCWRFILSKDNGNFSHMMQVWYPTGKMLKIWFSWGKSNSSFQCFMGYFEGKSTNLNLFHVLSYAL